ncbi:MAG: hypothetical protein WCG51_01410, partial [Elusimicrobiota bacterium]
MEIIQLDETNKGIWNTFCSQSDDAWFWHTADWMDYVVHYTPNLYAKQLSFFLQEDNKYVAICPLILEDHNGIKLFSFSGFGIPVPALGNAINSKARKKYLDYIFDYIDQQAKAHNVQKIFFRFSPLATSFVEASLPPTNYLLKYGYLDSSFNTQILDIAPSLEDLKSNLRKGHKYDINRTARVLDICIYDSASITPEIYQTYCDMHQKDAGRVTRAKITFDLMYEWITNGTAVLVGAKLKENGLFAGFGYMYVYKKGVYYGSACSEPDLGDLPVAHFILWESVKWFKEHSIRFLELGWQFFDASFHYHVSEKERTIARFKRGFGGELIPQLMAEKYFSAAIFEQEYLARMDRYKNYITE